MKSTQLYHKLKITIISCSLLVACKSEPEPTPTSSSYNPCEDMPGKNLYFGEYIYELDKDGWPVLITSNDTINGIGSDYRIYRYGGGVMTFTELSLESQTFWSFDSLNCNGTSCTHFFAQSDSNCNAIDNSCSSNMTLNIGNWVTKDGNTVYHYNDLMVLDSISYDNSTFLFSYFQGRISQIHEVNNIGDTVALQTFTFNSEDQWREYYREDFITNEVEKLLYSYHANGTLSSVSVGYGPQPITLYDFNISQEGCGENPRNLDPLNKYRLPHMHLNYIGLPLEQ